jgi:hypothetical protein
MSGTYFAPISLSDKMVFFGSQPNTISFAPTGVHHLIDNDHFSTRSRRSGLDWPHQTRYSAQGLFSLLPLYCLAYSLSLKMEIHSLKNCALSKIMALILIRSHFSESLQIQAAIYFRHFLHMMMIVFIRWAHLSHWPTLWHLPNCLLLAKSWKLEPQAWLLAGDLAAWVTYSTQF